jgi:hypothetical protein
MFLRKSCNSLLCGILHFNSLLCGVLHFNSLLCSVLHFNGSAFVEPCFHPWNKFSLFSEEKKKKVRQVIRKTVNFFMCQDLLSLRKEEDHVILICLASKYEIIS